MLYLIHALIIFVSFIIYSYFENVFKKNLFKNRHFNLSLAINFVICDVMFVTCNKIPPPHKKNKHVFFLICVLVHVI